MDWNVFFSTISQTSGAIVGIFSAFLITKIISNQSDFSRLEDRSNDFINKSNSLALEAGERYFDWYNTRTAEHQANKIYELYKNEGSLLSAEEYYDKLSFSLYQSKDDSLTYIKNIIDEINAKEEEKRNRIKSMRGFGAIMTSDFMDDFQRANMIRSTGLIKSIQEEYELISNLKVRILANICDARYLHRNLLKEEKGKSLITISIIAVMLLFSLGVVYPLSFLPLKVGQELSLTLSAFWSILFSVKGFFLTLITIIFSGLMFVFLYINIKLRHSADVINKVIAYRELKTYSEYFSIYENNVGLSPEA